MTDWHRQAGTRLSLGPRTHRAQQADKSARPALHLTENDYICRVRQIEIDMKEYFLKSIITALVFIGITIAFDAIFDEIDIIWKYLINGVLFGFVYEGWWHFYQKGVFSKEKILSLFKKKDSSK